MAQVVDENGSHLRFEAKIKVKGINPYVLVTAAQVNRIKPGWRRPVPVRVRINHCPQVWQVNMMPSRGGSFLLYLDGRIRQAAGADVGDRVALQISFDPEYRAGPQHDMPAALADDLAVHEAAMSRWESLSPSLKKEILRYLTTLKSETALSRNVKRALRVLGGAKERFLARDWN